MLKLETLEQVRTMFKVHNTDANDVVCFFFCFFFCFVVAAVFLNAGWVGLERLTH